MFPTSTSYNIGIGTTTPAYTLDVIGTLRTTATTTFSGNVGIGTTEPGKKLDVSGEIRASEGILFGTHTAAANTLNDYEEGAWTPSLSFDAGTTGITYSVQIGSYQKIGKHVTINGRIVLTSKGTSAGAGYIRGLPFPVSSTQQGTGGPATLYIENIAYTGTPQAYLNNPYPYFVMRYVTETGSGGYIMNTNFTNTAKIIISASYEAD